MRQLSAIAHEISGDWNRGDIKATIPPWERAVTLIHALPAQLNDEHQVLVVESLMTPWMEVFLQILKSGHQTKPIITDYYTLKNAILQALKTLKPAPTKP